MLVIASFACSIRFIKQSRVCHISLNAETRSNPAYSPKPSKFWFHSRLFLRNIGVLLVALKYLYFSLYSFCWRWIYYFLSLSSSRIFKLLKFEPGMPSFMSVNRLRISCVTLFSKLSLITLKSSLRRKSSICIFILWSRIAFGLLSRSFKSLLGDFSPIKFLCLISSLLRVSILAICRIYFLESLSNYYSLMISYSAFASSC